MEKNKTKTVNKNRIKQILENYDKSKKDLIHEKYEQIKRNDRLSAELERKKAAIEKSKRDIEKINAELNETKRRAKFISIFWPIIGVIFAAAGAIMMLLCLLGKCSPAKSEIEKTNTYATISLNAKQVDESTTICSESVTIPTSTFVGDVFSNDCFSLSNINVESDVSCWIKTINISK